MKYILSASHNTSPMKCLVIVGIALLLTTGQAWAGTYEDTYTPKANKVYDEDINVWVYTSEFAKRFGMPVRWVDEELKGAYAVAFRVESSSARTMFPHKGSNAFMHQRDCILDVYLPSHAPIPWIDNQIADKWWYTPDSPAYLAPQSPEDQAWKRRSIGVEQSGNKARRPLIRLNGGTLHIREYDRKLYSGITFISFNMGCMTPPKNRSKIELCKDEPWVGEACRASHDIDIPAIFMERLYGNWYERSRQPASSSWDEVFKNQGDN